MTESFDLSVPWSEALLKTRVNDLEQQLEIERMRLAACGVVALANTPESAANAREMLPQYRSASCDDVARLVDSEMALRQQLAAEIMRLEIALRIKTEEHKCCSEDLMKLRESEQSGWKEAAIAWEVCGSIHEAFAKKKDALYSTRHSDFERHAEDARRMLSTESKEKVE